MKNILSIFLAALWISLNEFVRNTFVLHGHWLKHYQSLGIPFPEQPVNGAVWGLWSLCFAGAIFFLAKKFTLLQTTLLAWWVGFVLMWLVLGNLGVLPLGILPIAIPLSVLETFGAVWIIKKIGHGVA